MKRTYRFAAALLLVMALASILLTNLYVSAARDTENNIQKAADNTGKETGASVQDGLAEHSRETFSVITSFYPMYIAAKNIVGDCEGVTLENLSEPQTGCMHDYQLTTEDMRRLSAADVLIVNGGGIESFLADVAAQYPKLAIINASEHTALLDDNAHAWMSISEHRIQVRTIADKLAKLDAAHADSYEKNREQYLCQLDELYEKQQEAAQETAGEKILIFHEAFDYMAQDYGMTVCGGMDLDEERQVSAGEVADVLRQIRTQEVRVILAEELYGKRMCETLQKETDIGVIYLDTCVRGDYRADSYLRAMEENITRMRQAVSK